MRLVFAAFLCMVVTAFAAQEAGGQNTIQVPAGQPTIQSGINAASNGDTVLVAPGTYFENLDFKGKAITVATRHRTTIRRARRPVMAGPQPVSCSRCLSISGIFRRFGNLEI